MIKDFQTKRLRLNKHNRSKNIQNFVFIVGTLVIAISILLLLIREVARTGAEYQCARLEQQFKQFPEQFFITPIESKMCPELQAPVKTIIN